MKKLCCVCTCLLMLFSITGIQKAKAKEVNDGDGTVCDTNSFICASQIPDQNLYTVLLKEGDKDNDGLLSITEAKKIQFLKATDAEISNLSGIEKFDNLISLTLSGNKIIDLTPLKNLKKISQLNLNGNQISNLDALKDMSSLRVIQLDNNQISDISALTKLKQLIGLTLNDNAVTSLDGIDELTNLEILRVENNKLVKLPNLSNLSKLETANKATSFIGNQLTEAELRAKLPDQLVENEEWIKDNACTNCEVKDPETEKPKPDNPQEPEQPNEPQKPENPGEVNPTPEEPGNDPVTPDEEFIYYITDEESDVTLIAKFPKGVQLVVNILKEEARSEVIDAIKDQNFTKKYNIEKLLDVYMLKDSLVYEPDGSMIVRIKLDESLKNKNPQIFYISAEGEITEMKSVIKDGYILFNTDHNSYYAIVTEKTERGPITNTGVQPIDNKMVAMILVGGLMLGTFKKRYHEE